MGDLEEARYNLIDKGYPRWAIGLITLGRLFLLGWAFLRIKSQDIVSPNGEVVGWGEEIYKLIQTGTTSDKSVLIRGESGTEREEVARAIHFNGPRGKYPFVVMNCGGIPDNMIESTLFGYVQGVSRHTGVLKQADRGTIFLDEVEKLPLHVQRKLLHVLNEKTSTPVGCSKRVTMDVRMIVATNRDLRKQMERGQFRCDLHYRMSVRILAERGVNPEGHDLDRKRLGRTNFVVLKAAIDRQVNAAVGHQARQRPDFTRPELDQIDQNFPGFVDHAVQEVFGAAN